MGSMKEPAAGLYQADYYAWVHAQVAALERRDFAHLDLINLIDEVGSLGRSEEREMESRLEQLLMHLLNREHQPSKRSPSWTGTIREQRRRLKLLFKRMPSLRPKVGEFLQDDYEQAREMAADETALVLATFPVECPYTADQVLDPAWLSAD